MKNLKSLFIFLVFLYSYVNCFTQDAVFTNINKGETIKNRSKFPVATSIANFDNSNGYYWVAIASVQHTEAAEWRRTILLYNELKETDDANKKIELLDKISNWNIDLFWPKFHVLKSNLQKDLYDGGNNPLEGIEPQPMILIVIKVDDSFNDSIKEWFYEGNAGKGYPGFPISLLPDTAIKGRCELFFP